ncbi:MAG: acyltransferase [Acidobacteriia bacterium]|nr:acyltransferase [Terriglobia bacterium]
MAWRFARFEKRPVDGHLPALTGLRFLLALWVMLHHLTGPGMRLDAVARTWPHPVYAFIRGGYLAVATFFVLSGFVLARSYGSGGWHGDRLRRYAVARFARIYPVYALSLALVAPFVLADRASGKPGLIANYGLLLQGWTGHLPVGWNTPAWSLSCEIFFYICFPLTVVALRRVNPGVLAVAACLLTRVLFAVGVHDEWKPLVHFADFTMGIAAASLYDRLLQARRRPAGYWFYLPGAALGAALIAWPELLPGGVDLNSALRPLNAMLLVGFALGSGVAARALSSRLAVFLGKSSYAMYILHVPVLWWVRRWALDFSDAGYVALVILISSVVYRYVEEPANRYIRAWV